MSQIFSWLKRAESERRKSPPDMETERLEILVQDDSPASETPLEMPLPVITPTEIDVIPEGGFDLARADFRVRTVLDPHTVAGEQYRVLRSKLAQMQKERGIKSLLVTSSVPYEGKTFTACCLAGVFAQEPGKRVVLIDADLRKPRVGHALGMNGNTPPGGLVQVLRGQQKAEDALVKTRGAPLFLLPAGPVPQDPAELLSSPNMELAIRTLSASFDWVIIDSPPVAAMADAAILAPLVDGVLLVVYQDRTSAKIIKETIKLLGQKRICGVVLNRGRHLKSSKYYYRYYQKRSDEVLTS